MDTLIIIRDTLTANVEKVIDSCQPFTQEAETNYKDVIIVAIICLTILLFTGIVIYALYLNKKEQDNDSLSTKALEILNRFVELSKGKDENVDFDSINKLFDVHKIIKESLKEDNVKNKQESEHEEG